MNAGLATDLSKTRSPYSLGNRLARVLWGVVWFCLFRPSPRCLYPWRRALLRLFKARIGQGVEVDNRVEIWAPWNLEIGDYSAIGHHVDLYCLAPITIGAHSIVSQYSFLCTGTHNLVERHFPVESRPIRIGDGAWVAADVFIGPGVTVGDGAVVGARSSVFKDVAPGTVVAGNPARFIKKRLAGERAE